MAETKSISEDEHIKQHTGRDPAKLPANFKKILAEEIKILRLPLSTPKHPFKSVCPPAVDSECVQTGFGGYLFIDIDYAIIKFLFGMTNPSGLSKSILKDWLVNKCNVPHSELEKCPWPDIREFSLSGIEAEDAIIITNNEPLSDKALAVLHLLQEQPPNQGLTGPQILKKLDDKKIIISQSALTKSIIPALKPHGVKNKPRIGYYIHNK